MHPGAEWTASARRTAAGARRRLSTGWMCCAPFFLAWAACTPRPPEAAPTAVVASAYGATLTAEDLVYLLPASLSPEDSAAQAQRAIGEWQQRQTLVHLASTELPAEERDFDRAVARYRESLLIHAYEDRYLREHLDTALTADELEAFLTEQPDLFRLSEPLFRARWIVFPKDRPFPRDIRDLTKQLASEDAETLSALASRCTDAGMPFDLDAERWWTWGELARVLPLQPRLAARQQASQRVSRIEWKADTAAGRPADERALLLVTERLSAGDVSPVERVADRITELLLHRRRNRTLADMRQQAVQAAWAEAALSQGATPIAAPATDTP